VRPLALAVAALSLCLGSPVHAVTLDDLNLGTSFDSSDGTLTFAFDPGSVVLNGSLPGDLTDYLVTPLVGGFQVSGPLAALNGSLGGLTLVYQVTADLGLLLDSASLTTTGVAVGASALGAVGQTLSNGAGLGVIVTGFGANVLVDGTSFVPAAALAAVTSIQLLALGAGEAVVLGSVGQSFTLVAVPEARTGLLLAAGLLGLAFFGSPERRLQTAARRGSGQRG
jgi:hypothetical protein